jgi:lipopolysaccharide/colanic/teichoic acid biosynthesis glycosyltransferase
VLGAKPGITGLWQVHGRSRVSYETMVRMDLRYSQRLSLFADALLLLQTVRAVLSTEGAY